MDWGNEFMERNRKRSKRNTEMWCGAWEGVLESVETRAVGEQRKQGNNDSEIYAIPSSCSVFFAFVAFFNTVRLTSVLHWVVMFRSDLFIYLLT